MLKSFFFYDTATTQIYTSLHTLSPPCSLPIFILDVRYQRVPQLVVAGHGKEHAGQQRQQFRRDSRPLTQPRQRARRKGAEDVGGDHHLPPSAGVAPALRAAGMAPPRASMIRCSSSATSQQTISVQASWEAKCAPRSCWETPNTSPAHRPAASPFQRHCGRVRPKKKNSATHA